MEERRVRVVVHGRVQGVFFRGFTELRAQELGVAGWVRNRADGAVEAVFEGAPEAVGTMVEHCRAGPRWARVEHVEVHEEPPEQLRGFRVRS